MFSITGDHRSIWHYNSFILSIGEVIDGSFDQNRSKKTQKSIHEFLSEWDASTVKLTGSARRIHSVMRGSGKFCFFFCASRRYFLNKASNHSDLFSAGKSCVFWIFFVLFISSLDPQIIFYQHLNWKKNIEIWSV